MAAMNLIAFGPVGSDAPVLVYIPGKGFKVIGGWNREGIEIVRSAMTIANEAVAVKHQSAKRQMLDVAAAMLKTQDEYLEQAVEK